MSFNEISLLVNTILSVLSFLLAAISVITVIVSLKQNGKMIQISSEQISEMIKEHELSLQPIVAFSCPQFIVEKPRLFYSPPEDEYKIISRFRFRVEVKNISSAVAVNFVCTGVNIFKENNESLMEESPSKRINILADNSEKLDFMFLEKKRGETFSCLREGNTSKVPQGEFVAVYRNTSGGAFRMRIRYIIYPGKEEIEEIKKWHSIVSSAYVDYKEELIKLKKGNDKEDVLFNQLKEIIDQRGGEKKEIQIDCIELDRYFTYEPISLEEYEKAVGSKYFSTFIGSRQEECIHNKKD